MAGLNTVDLVGVEVLKPGVWNGRPYTETEMDLMVDAFRNLRGVYTPMAKLGHNTTQRLGKNAGLVDSDGHPALGTVTNLYKRGTSVVADFANVPAKLAGLIQAGAYGPRSCEVWFNKKFNDAAFPVVLKNVSWLGADAPAVSGLDEYIAMYSDEAGDQVHTAMLTTAPTTPVNGKAQAKGYSKSQGPFADPTNQKWPLNKRSRIVSAMGYYNAGSGRDGYSSPQWAAVGGRIVRAANSAIGSGYTLRGGQITKPKGNAMTKKKAQLAAAPTNEQELRDAIDRVFAGLTAAGPQAAGLLKETRAGLKSLSGQFQNGGYSGEGGMHRENIGTGTFPAGGYDTRGANGPNTQQGSSGTGYWGNGGIDVNGNTRPLGSPGATSLAGNPPAGMAPAGATTQPGVQNPSGQPAAGKKGKAARRAAKAKGKAYMSSRADLEAACGAAGIDLGGQRLSKRELREKLGVPREQAALSSADLSRILGIDDGDPGAIKQALIELKARSVDLSEHQQLRTEVTTLTREKAEAAAHTVVEAAVREGKIAPKQREWAETYCLSDRDGFDRFLEAAPKVVDYETLGSDGTFQSPMSVTDSTLRVAAAMGISPDRFMETKTLEERLREQSQGRDSNVVSLPGHIIRTGRQERAAV